MKANAHFEFSGFQTADALVYKNLGKKATSHRSAYTRQICDFMCGEENDSDLKA